MRECTLTNITILKTYLLRNCQDQRIADCDYYYLTILNIENVEKKDLHRMPLLVGETRCMDKK